MSLNLVTLLYLVASICFIQALKGLSHPTTSIKGNFFGMTGMAIAIATTVGLIVMLAQDTATNGLTYVLAGLVIGGGAGAIMGTGVVGAVIFFVVGALMSKGIRGTQSAAEEYRAKLRKTLANTAFVTASREEHKRRIAEALVQSVPQLREIAQTPGEFAPDLKQRSELLEAALRDEIRGRGLINPAIKQAVLGARGRGIEVILLDEGGLDDATTIERDAILLEAAKAIDSVEAGRITLRAPQGEQWRVTLMATRSGVTAPDLWLKF